MRFKQIMVSAVVLTGSLVALTNGCSSDEEPKRGASLKGQACQVTGDCAEGLACQPTAAGIGICVVGEFRVSATARECAIIDCETPADCCPTPPPNCTTLAQQCANADGGTASFECQTYAAVCQCDTTKNDCQNNKCIKRCKENVECPSSAPRCAGGTCVECASDPDCGGGSLQCINGKCQAPCKTDGDCPGFNRCVSGRCIESGCQTNRECIAATRKVEATCGTDGKCIVPCSTDLECGNPTDYKFFSCIDRRCTYTGCQSDKDCRLFLTGLSDAGVLGTKQHVVCRDQARPGATTASP